MAVSPRPRNHLNQPVWNFLGKQSVTLSVSIPLGRRANLHKRPFSFSSPPQKKMPQPTIMLSFQLLIVPLLHPSSYKNLPFCRTQTPEWLTDKGVDRAQVRGLGLWILPMGKEGGHAVNQAFRHPHHVTLSQGIAIVSRCLGGLTINNEKGQDVPGMLGRT